MSGRKLAIAAAATALAFAALPAGAAVITCTANQTTTYTLTLSSQAQCFTGNTLGDKGIQASDLTVLGLNGWILQDSTDATANGAGQVNFTQAPVGGAKSGNWAITGITLPYLMITLKAGNSFAAFLISNAVPQSGTWAVSRALSHSDVFSKGTPSSNVPLPAAAWLILGGLGGLGLMSRRKAKAA